MSPSPSKGETAQARPLEHFPGFDSLRLLAALGVIFSHAYVIGGGGHALPAEVAYRMGEYGVYTFFIISGFLLARSLSANSDPIVYAVNRILRLLPAFVFYSLVMGLLIGPAFSTWAPTDYFRSEQLYAFFRWGLDSLTSPDLPGVFIRDDPQSGIVNGSLWSLHYEALSYLFLIALWMLFRGPSLVACVMMAVSIFTVVSPSARHLLPSIAHTLPFFAGGVLLNVVYLRVGMHGWAAVVCAIAILVGGLLGVAPLVFSVFGAYLVIYFGRLPNFLTRPIARIGDLSYGLYLFGWPVEQAIRQVSPGAGPMAIFCIAVPVTAVFAFLSCRLVEQPAMRLRRPAATFIRNGLRSLGERAGRSRQAMIWGATASFVVTAFALLASSSQWWFVLASFGKVVAAAAVGAIGTCVLHRLLSSQRGPAIET